ncbi:helix-turn-helix transcriptional regulator [Streptomyces phaeochromogenes]|uniref:helix-turn-helix domain-containing protein n=1 Tax=Streptomyces phaeochromogenes TaxID=1923 RepID=UPI002DDB96D3|nr:helix-turn-helix transcriptional regulator [Streptomyces phaeochromogenes]WRZ30235.1 helix-turn-helix transcriptional regulator [Streptomyces phaeochromogenes]
MKPDGPTIRAIRKARNVSLRGLEERTGLSRGYLSRLERGEIADAGEDKVQRVATELNVDLPLITFEE